MSNHVVTGILWTLAAVTLVAYLAGLVALRQNEQDWSQVRVPSRHVTYGCVGRAAGTWCR